MNILNTLSHIYPTICIITNSRIDRGCYRRKAHAAYYDYGDMVGYFVASILSLLGTASIFFSFNRDAKPPKWL